MYHRTVIMTMIVIMLFKIPSPLTKSANPKEKSEQTIPAILTLCDRIKNKE